MDVAAAPFDAAALITEVLAPLQRLAQHKGLALHAEHPSALPMVSDRHKVAQLLGTW